MKKAKYRRSALRKTAARLAAVLIAMMFVAVQPLSAFAIDDGDTINYTSRKLLMHGTQVPEFTSGDFIGTCAQAGNPALEAGQATVTRLARNSAGAKAAYHAYLNDALWDDTTVGGFSQVTVSSRALYCVQIAQQGWQTWTEVAPVSEDVIAYIGSYYDQTIPNITVPSNFQAYYCIDSTGYQAFVIWRIAPTGKLKLRKASANTGITG